VSSEEVSVDILTARNSQDENIQNHHFDRNLSDETLNMEDDEDFVRSFQNKSKLKVENQSGRPDRQQEDSDTSAEAGSSHQPGRAKNRDLELALDPSTVNYNNRGSSPITRRIPQMLGLWLRSDEQQSYIKKFSKWITKIGGITLIGSIGIAVLNFFMINFDLKWAAYTMVKVESVMPLLAWYWISVDDHIRMTTDAKFLSAIRALFTCRIWPYRLRAWADQLESM
jgi:hypothetical protein